MTTTLELITHGTYLCIIVMYHTLYYLECRKSMKYKGLYDEALHNLIISSIKLTHEKAKNTEELPIKVILE